jgi:hypothetical protein
VLTNDFMRNRSARHRYALHVAARSIDSLANRFGNFIRLAGGKSNFALTVSDGNECIEREATSALHDLRDAIDGNHVLDELASAIAAAFTAAAFASALSVT